MKIRSWMCDYYDTKGLLVTTDKHKYYDPIESTEEDLVKNVYQRLLRSAKSLKGEDYFGFILTINTSHGKYIFHNKEIMPRTP